ncbi:MAG: cytochrome c [Sphingobacteriales bacterium]|nr:MAG: cytochrome c [Sphingobacteriales bacterium]
MKKILSAAIIAFMLASCGDGKNESVKDDDAALGGNGNTVANMSPGHKLFLNNCLQCHNIKSDKVGPKLEGVMARWNNDTTQMYAFIRNSQAVIKSGHPRAVKVFDEYNQTLMTPMPHLTDADIAQIMEYINKGEE